MFRFYYFLIYFISKGIYFYDSLSDSFVSKIGNIWLKTLVNYSFVLSIKVNMTTTLKAFEWTQVPAIHIKGLKN